MKKKSLTALCFVALFSVLVGCNAKSDLGSEVTSEVTENESNTAIHTDEQAVDWYELQQHIASKELHDYTHITNMVDNLYGTDPKNTILSETSLDMALGMVMQGATGDAMSEFESYYGVSSADKLSRDHDLILLYNNRDDVTLNLANSFYIDEGIEIDDTYKTRISDGYFAGIDNLDFKDAGSADIINNWCADHTNNMIKEIVTPETLKDLDAALINALYFNGTWSEIFEEYQVRDTEFTNVSGDIVTVDGMYDSGLDTYYETNNAIGFSKYYIGNNISFIGILPDESILDENKDFKLSDIDLDKFLQSKTSEYDVDIMIPSFKIEDSNSLTDVLKTQGLVSTFESGHLLNINPDIYVSDVIQKTVVDVNPKGTEAAAVTMVEMMCGTAMPEEVEIKSVILDRPFAFMIYDEMNDEILFIGKIVELQNK